jgi:hypothetical protein
MLYVISKDDLSIKDIVQITDFDIEENINLNGKSTFTLSRLPIAVKDDFIQYGEFKGIISNIETTKDTQTFRVQIEDINSLFDRKIILTNEALIASTGLEDFIEQTIKDRWSESADTLLNLTYINLTVATHTPLNFSVETQDDVYNFRTFLGNMKERYGVELSYDFSSQLNITIAKTSPSELDLDLTISDIVDYDEVYSVDVIAKVIVLSKATNTEFNYYLKNDRTITTNASDVNRVKGKVESVTCEADVDASQKAIDTFKSNSYKHNISFELISDSLVYENDELYVNRPLRIKTLDNGVYSTFIAKKKYKFKSTVYEYECGNIKVNLVDKLKGVL